MPFVGEPVKVGTPVRVIGVLSARFRPPHQHLPQPGDEGVVEAYAGWQTPRGYKVERSRLGEGWVGPRGPFYATPKEAYETAYRWGVSPNTATHFYLVRLVRLEQPQLVAGIDMTVTSP